VAVCNPVPAGRPRCRRLQPRLSSDLGLSRRFRRLPPAAAATLHAPPTARRRRTGLAAAWRGIEAFAFGTGRPPSGAAAPPAGPLFRCRWSRSGAPAPPRHRCRPGRRRWRSRVAAQAAAAGSAAGAAQTAAAAAVAVSRRTRPLQATVAAVAALLPLPPSRATVGPRRRRCCRRAAGAGLGPCSAGRPADAAAARPLPRPTPPGLRPGRRAVTHRPAVTGGTTIAAGGRPCRPAPPLPYRPCPPCPPDTPGRRNRIAARVICPPAACQAPALRPCRAVHRRLPAHCRARAGLPAARVPPLPPSPPLGRHEFAPCAAGPPGAVPVPAFAAAAHSIHLRLYLPPLHPSPP